MKQLHDQDPKILAEILGEKSSEIPAADPLRSNLTPLQRKAMKKAYEEDICLDFFPPEPSANSKSES